MGGAERRGVIGGGQWMGVMGRGGRVLWSGRGVGFMGGGGRVLWTGWWWGCRGVMGGG